MGRQSRGSGSKPSLTRIASIKGLEYPVWALKFNPYVYEQDDPPIFAAVSYLSVFIYFIDRDDDSGIQLLNLFHKPADFRDPQLDKNWINCCTWCWTSEPDPMIAVAGESGHILLIEAMSGKLAHTLAGHSDGVINELITHPKYPWIIASASIDCSIRVWDLRRTNDPTVSTCVVICGHHLAHTQGLVSIAWHDCGRYIVSGGYDYKVCVWTLPDLDPDSSFWYEISKEGRKRSRDEVRVIYYPHFVSAALHADIVDAVSFFGDFVLSKASKEDKIVLTAITGFRGEMRPPDQMTAPKAQQELETLNGFRRPQNTYIDDDTTASVGDRTLEAGHFIRCLELENANSEAFYMRFGIRKSSRLFPDIRPILTTGDHHSNIRLWDLQALTEGHRPPSKGRPRKSFADPLARLRSSIVASGRGSRESSVASSIDDSSSYAGSTTASIPQTTAVQEKGGGEQNRSPLCGLEKPVKPHIQLAETKNHIRFTTRAVDWSVCGQYVVSAGEAWEGYPTSDEGPATHGAILVHKLVW